MRIFTIKPQVTSPGDTREKLRSRLPSWLLVSFLLCALSLGSSLGEDDSSWRDSLVRISFKYETSGVFQGEEYVSQSKVIEITQLQGVVCDARGYVVAYVGNHWLKMRTPQSRLVIEYSDGKSEPGKLVAVDERIAMAVMESPRAANREIVRGHALKQKQLEIVTSLNGEWGKSSLCVVGVRSHRLLPEKTIKARICKPARDRETETGSLVLDPKGRFLGIVTDVDEVGVSNTIKAYQVIPTEVINESLRRVVSEGKNLRGGYLGISGETVSDRVLVTEVVDDTPASDAGLLAGDVVLELDAEPIQDLAEFGRILRWKGPGSRVELTLQREDGLKTVEPVLVAYPETKLVYGWQLELPKVWGEADVEEELRLSPAPLPSHARFGLVVDTLSPQLASYFKAPHGRCLLVTTVLKESLASRAGFRAGDVLIEINGRELSSPSVMREVLHSGKDGVIIIRYLRDGQIHVRKLVLP